MKLQLGWIGEGSQLGTPAPVVSRRKARSRLAWALAGVFLLSTAILASVLLDQPGPTAEVHRLSILPPEGVSLGMDPPETIISPDGSMVVFVCTDSTGSRSLWLRRLDSLEAKPLPGTEDPLTPFWSPDSRFVAFFSEPHLKKIAVADHSVQIICNAVSGRGGTWNEDGIILFCPASAGPLFQVSASGGEPLQVTELDTTAGETAQRFPQFLPDGKTFIYVSLPKVKYWKAKVASLENPEPKTILTASSGAIFADPGYLLFARDGTLFAQKFNTKKLELEGDPISLPDRPGGYRGYNGSTELSASTNGRLFFPQNEFETTQAFWFDRKGTRVGRVLLQRGYYGFSTLSPAGNWLAMEREEEGRREVWVMNLQRGIMNRLTFERGGNQNPVWSPDGSEIVFSSSDDKGTANIYKKNSSGAGVVEKLTKLTGVFNDPRDWSPDGEFIVIRRLMEETGEDIYLLSTKTGDIKPFLNSRFNEDGGSVSPDGKWLAYRSDESGSVELYVQSFPEPAAKIRISTDGASSPFGTYFSLAVWTKDGRELIYIAGDGYTLKSAPIEYTPTFRVGTPKTLFRLPQNCNGFTTRDGKKFLVLIRGEGEITPNLTVVFNWTEELKGR